MIMPPMAPALPPVWFASFKCWVSSARDVYRSWHQTHLKISKLAESPGPMRLEGDCGCHVATGLSLLGPDEGRDDLLGDCCCCASSDMRWRVERAA